MNKLVGSVSCRVAYRVSREEDQNSSMETRHAVPLH